VAGGAGKRVVAPAADEVYTANATKEEGPARRRGYISAIIACSCSVRGGISGDAGGRQR